MKLQYAVVYERTLSNYSAYPPDLPGCVSTGKTWEDIQEMIQEAIALHIEATLEEGLPFPEPRMSVEEAMDHHSRLLADGEGELAAEYGDRTATVSTTFHLVEVEFAAPDPVRTG